MSHVKYLIAHNNSEDFLPEVDFLRHLKEWVMRQRGKQ